MTRKELRDRQAKHDAYWSKKGQDAATRYLRSKPQPNGRIREAIASLAFLILISAVTITLLLM